MKIPTDPVKRLMLAVCALLLVCAVLRWSLPILKILLALVVTLAAWLLADDSPKGKNASSSASKHFSHFGGISEIREEGGVQIRRHVLSSAVLDLTDCSLLSETIEMQCAFSSVSVHLPVDANIALHASGAFCSVALPDGQSVLFGENTVHCGSQDVSAPRLRIELQCVFSSVSFKMG